MTRLFLRFYIGVLLILFLAWQIQSYVYKQTNAEQNMRVVEHALGGGVRLAMQRVAKTKSETEAGEVLDELNRQFEYGVHWFSLTEDWLDDIPRKRLNQDAVVLLGDRVAIAFPDHVGGLVFGPLPQFVGPRQTVVNFGFGAIFLLSALAIAILLRPVAAQLRAVERTAAAIAAGDLSARIDGATGPRGLPLARAFNVMADRTESLLESQRELLQGVSHELRTPLARLRFATDLLSSSTSDKERHERLQIMDRATQELDNLVGELLTYVRFADAPRQESQFVNLNQLCDELVSQYALLSPEVEFNVESTGDPSVIANRESLARAIGNLLSNAARFAQHKVIVRTQEEARHVTVFVEDDGAGVPQADRDRIFDPFVRLESIENHEGVGGAGIGLALVQRIAARLGGAIKVQDSETGACFCLAIPKALQEEPA